MERAPLWGLLVGIAGALIAPDALACGGCFHPPTADSVVTGHRMVFALSPGRTVLWDQIRYTGQPSEFGWVLPVAHGAYVEASTDAWFEALEAATAVQVTAPTLKCATDRTSSGCGSDKAMALPSAGSLDFSGRVNVLHEGTVGPYETVTLASTDGSALRSWLDQRGYAVPPEIEPVIDTYVAEGSDFIALRLIPGKDVTSMTPVRVVTPQGPPMLPLRMVAAGTGAFVDIVLYVIGEGRYLLQDFTESHVDLGALTFDFAQNTSNYAMLRENALGEHDGYSFLTAFALSSAFGGNGVYTGAGTLADLYFSQAASNDNQQPSSSCYSVASRLDSGERVGDGGASTIAASDLACGTYTDLASALTGLRPDRTWLTRLEMNLPHEALSADCTVALSGAQSAVSNQLLASKTANRPFGCPEPIFESRMARAPAPSSETFAWGLASFAALLVLRRGRGLRK